MFRVLHKLGVQKLTRFRFKWGFGLEAQQRYFSSEGKARRSALSPAATHRESAQKGRGTATYIDAKSERMHIRLKAMR